MKKLSPRFSSVAALSLAVFLSATVMSSGAPANGLVAHYKLDGNAMDSSGNGLHGTMNGGTPVADRFGQPNSAIAFNGLSDLINLGNPSEFQFDGSFTLSVWVKANGSQPRKYILAKYFSSQEGMPNSYGLGTTDDGVGRPYGFVSVEGWPGYVQVGTGHFGYPPGGAGQPLNDEAWHPLALVYDSNYGLKLYQNGALVGQAAAPNRPPFTNAPSLTLGGLADGQYFGGLLDDVRIYSRALTASEIEDIAFRGETKIRFQSPTATYSQSIPVPLTPAHAIDGDSGGFLGWGIETSNTEQTAVFETTTDIAATPSSILTFNLFFSHFSPTPSVTHTLGRFRLSVTADPRSQFADGQTTGGDVTANWIVLQPLTVTSRAGATLTALEDGSILASGSSNYLDVYTVTAHSSVSGITGVRIEALQHPSLPKNGPGRDPVNGNFLLSEFVASIMTPPISAPKIVAQPQSQEIEIGGSAIFSVTADSEAPVRYQWFFNGAPISFGTNSTFLVGLAQPDRAGTYTVTVSNDYGSVTSSGAVLTVTNAVPTDGGTVLFSNLAGFINAPITDAYGQNLAGPQFLVQLYGGPSSSALRPIGPAVPFGTGPAAGYFNGGTRQIPGVPPGSPAAVSVRAWEAAFGTTFEQASVNGGMFGHSDPFFVVLGGGENPPSELVGLGSFRLFGPPRFTLQPAGATFPTGSNYTFTVEVRGTAPIAIQWFKNGEPIPGANALTLSLENLKLSDSGTYHAVADNFVGTATSHSAVLVVRDFDLQAPVVTITSPSAGSTDIRDIIFSGQATDNVAVTRVEWLRNGTFQGSLQLAGNSFSRSVTLSPGENVFTVRAYDAENNVGTATVSVTFANSRAISLGETVPARDGTDLRVPILLRSNGDVGGASFTLTYPRDYLGEPSLTWTHGQGGITQVNTNTTGQIRASFALSGTTLPSGTLELAVATFRVRSLPSNTSVQLGLSLQGIFGADGQSLVSATDALGREVQLIRRKHTGDNNGNDQLDIGDASIIMRLLTLLDPLRAWDVPLNDLNLNSQIDAGDAIRVLRAVVGLDPQPSSAVQGQSRLFAQSQESRLSLTADKLAAAVNEKIKVQVELADSLQLISGASFRLTFPTNGLWLDSASAIKVGSAVPPNTLGLWNLEPSQNDFSLQSGVIHFGFSSSEPWTITQGDLLELTFTLKPGAIALPELIVNLEGVQTTDGWDVTTSAGSQLVFAALEPIMANFSGATRGANGEFELRAAGDPALRYAVETSTDLLTWTSAGNASNQSGAITFSDADPGDPVRFYRLKQLD